MIATKGVADLARTADFHVLARDRGYEAFEERLNRR
jgi:hypothetical protein